MSTDFIALFDAPGDVASAEWLLAKVTVSPCFALELVERYRDFWRPKVWAIETWPIHSPPATARSVIVGPGGFAMEVKPRTIEMYHMMRFSTFTGDSWYRDALRVACVRIADLVGSARAIYTHELMPYDGEGLHEIEAGLRARIGPPAATFEELHAAEYYGPRAWYIDTFADLRSSSRAE